MEKLFVTGKASISMNKSIRTESLYGRDFSVLPAVMMVEGAYFPNVSGLENPGALFFSENSIKESVLSWNGRPVSLDHPKDSVSCNSPKVLRNQWLGYVFNTVFDETQKGLSCEMWLDLERSKPIIDRYSNGEKIDVSIGAFGEIIDENGESKGVQYSKKIEKVLGDHLAILPDSKGACSWADGCGIRAELKQGENVEEKTMEKEMNDSKNDIKAERAEEECNKKIVEASEKGAVTENISLAEFIDNAPKGIKEALLDQRETYLSLKNGLITNILAFEEVKFDENFLGDLKKCHLQKLSDLVDIAKNANTPAGEKIETKQSANFGVNAVREEKNEKEYASVVEHFDWN